MKLPTYMYIHARSSSVSLVTTTTHHPLPATLPMGLPDNVLIGQAVHEAVVTPALDCLFREGQQLRRALEDEEVVGACIVDDLNLFAIFCEGSQPHAAAASRTSCVRPTLCEKAGPPSKVSKAEWPRKVREKLQV